MLRAYQRRARVAVLCDWTEVDATMAVMATGLGKTELFVSLANDWKDKRSMVMVPDIQLVGQAAAKIRQRTGEQPAIEQGSRWANESVYGQSRFVVASIPTLLSQNRYKRFDNIGLVIIDECDQGMTERRQVMIRHFIDHGAKVLGVTASPKRVDGLAMGNAFDRCSFNYGIADAMNDGWLVPAEVCCLQLQSLDLSHVKLTSTGDFNQEELNAVMETDKVVYEIAAAVAQESGTMKTVVYCGRVKGARAIAEYLVDKWGLDAAWVCGDDNLQPRAHRKEICDSFTKDPAGVQIVCNVGVLARGWDFPGLEHIVNAAPTMSLPKLTQIFGRGTRPLKGTVDFEGSTAETRKAAIANSAKPHFVFTDLRDAVLRHKLVSPVDVLAGRMGLPWSDVAKRNLSQLRKRLALDKAIADAKREIEAEQHRKERGVRRQIETKAAFHKVAVDVFDPHQIAPAVGEKSDKRVIDPPTHKQVAFLRYKGLDIRGLEVSKKQAGRMITQFTKGATLEEVQRTNRLRRPASAKSKPKASSNVDDVNRLFQEL